MGQKGQKKLSTITHILKVIMTDMKACPDITSIARSIPGPTPITITQE